MSFVHDDAHAFDALVGIVANEHAISLALVEKDYWVTHALWALHRTGFEVWFKGGTSLSKGFRLVERFSEDLDLRIEPGTVKSLAAVTNWKSDGAKAVGERQAYFEKLSTIVDVPGTRVTLDESAVDPKWRGVELHVAYPGRHLVGLGNLAPFVRLEVGVARVTPWIPCDMSSFVHEHLERIGQLGEFTDNRPIGVRCVHPLVTLIEKLDAIRKRHARRADPATYVRHFEDAARIIRGESAIAPLVGHASVAALAAGMKGERQIADVPLANDPSFRPSDDVQWTGLERAHEAIAPMFWGDRIPLEDCCAAIRAWLEHTLG